MNTAYSGRNALIALALLGLAACGNANGKADQASPSLTSAARQAITQALPGGKSGETPAAAPKTPAEMSAEALRVNPGPLILVGLENRGSTQVMAMTGQNGSSRTYMTPNEQALILRDGLLVGTRGLGHDLSVAEAQTEPLIRAGAAGQGTRVMRYYTGDGLETPLQFECQTGAGPKAGVLVENCTGHGVTFENSYITQGGSIQVSRQWIGPNLGYVTIQTLRN